MERNYLFDIDSLLAVLQAIKEGRDVEFRPLEEPDWRDFNPEENDIDTENCKYRVKPCGYGDDIGVIPISPEDLQEDRIYFLRSNIVTSTIKGFICVKCNLLKENKMIYLHFSWNSDGLCPTLKVNDPDADCGSVQSKGFVNSIGFNLVSDNFENVSIYHPSQAQVSMLESKLREVGYELKGGRMLRIDGNEA